VTKRVATFVAFALASVVPALVMSAFAVGSQPGVRASGPTESLIFACVSFLVFLPYSILFVVLIGVPIFLILRKLGSLNGWSALFVGACVGAVIPLLLQSHPLPYGYWLWRTAPTRAREDMWSRTRSDSREASIPTVTPLRIPSVTLTGWDWIALLSAALLLALRQVVR
jgi:hypothetical protein